MLKFRDINQKEEILTLMQKAPISNPGEIWQTLPDVRHHYKIINVKDDPINHAIVIEGPRKFEFSTKHPVYVRINHRDLIFKLTARSFIISGSKLACIYPKMAKAIDKRGIERIPLPPERETRMVLRPLGLGAAELTVNLIDISKKGLGISISDMNRDYLLRNQKFRITSINDVLLAGDHQLDIIYVERIGRGVMKSGFKLARPFTDETYNLICKIIFGA